MTLKVTTEPQENRQLMMKVEVGQERVDQELRKAARKLATQANIPGFRKGKAPYPMVVQYVGLPALFNEFIEPLGEEIYKQAIEQEKIEPYAMAALDVDGLAPLTYTFVVPLEPEVELGDYRSLRVEQDSLEVGDAEVDARLEEYREQYADWTDVDRASQYGDTLTLDVNSVIPAAEEGAEETVVLDETEWEVTLDEEHPLDPPGFDEALLGLRPGDEKDFSLSWPDDAQSIYAGKQANFHVKVHKISAHEKPPLDDSLAALVGPDFETLDALKENIRTTLLDAKKREAEESYLEKALDMLVDQSTMVYPPTVVEDQIDTMVEEFARFLRRYGVQDINAYLQQSGQTMEGYRDNLRPQAEAIARRNLVLSELYEREGLTVSDEEIEARIGTMVGRPVTRSVQPEAGEEASGEANQSEGESATEPAGEQASELSAELTAELTDEPEHSHEHEHGHDHDDEHPHAHDDEHDHEHDHDHTHAHDHDHDHDHEHEHDEEDEDESAMMLAQIMRTGAGRPVLESQILRDKAVDRLLAIVRGEEVPPPPAKPEAAAEAVAETSAESSPSTPAAEAEQPAESEA